MKSIKVCEYSWSRSFHDDLILQDQASGERSQYQWSSGLAHLSGRLTGELIVYLAPASVRRSQFQRSSSLKSLGQSKPNFMWSILRKEEQKLI